MSNSGSIRRAESSKSSPRNIAAPFQNGLDTNGMSGQHSPTGKNGDHNELRFEFSPLEDLSEVTYEKVPVIKLHNNLYIFNYLLLMNA